MKELAFKVILDIGCVRGLNGLTVCCGGGVQRAGGAESSRSMRPSKSEMGRFCGAGSVWSSWAPVLASLWYMASAWSRVVVLHSFQDGAVLRWGRS